MGTEPSYDVPKQRHYDPSDIRVYMQKQKDERKRKQLEREQATRRNEEMKKQRLKVRTYIRTYFSQVHNWSQSRVNSHS